MKALIILSFILSLGVKANVVSYESAEAAAALAIDMKCGGKGKLVTDEQVDEDYDYAIYYIEMTNGYATVVATDDVSYDGNYYNDIKYEVDEVVCL